MIFTLHTTMLFVLVIWLHFFGDFLFQTNEMATKKSTSFEWLTIHVGVYCLPLMLLGFKYALVNAALHWLTDAVTSRVTSKLYKSGDRHWFFVVIGLDQAIHMTCLYLTLFKWAVF